MVLDQFSPAHEHHLSVGRRHVGPHTALESGPCDTNRMISVLDAAISDVSELLAVTGTDGCPSLAGQRVLVASVNECAALEIELCSQRCPVLFGLV